VPIIGLRYSMTRRTFLSAWLVTLGVGLVIPVLIALAISAASASVSPAGMPGFGYGNRRMLPVGILFGLGWQLVVAVLAWQRLQAVLVRRQFLAAIG
jgi:hypothetical protein